MALNCLGVSVAQMEFPQFMEWWRRAMKGTGSNQTLALVNAHTLNLAVADPEFARVLNEFSLVLNDGVGLEICGRMQGHPFLYNFNGTDLFPTVFSQWEKEGEHLKVFLLGAKPGVAQKASEILRARYPNLSVVGSENGYSQRTDADLIGEINRTNADLLLVALGNPMQEKWIAKHRSELQVRVACGVGALFDFLSGEVSRAPVWMRALRLEWVFRFCLEPRRMAKRYLIGNVLFLSRLLWQIWGVKRGHS